METATEEELKAFYSHAEEDGPLEDEILTHDGMWKKDGDVYLWFPHEELSVPHRVSIV